MTTKLFGALPLVGVLLFTAACGGKADKPAPPAAAPPAATSAAPPPSAPAPAPAGSATCTWIPDPGAAATAVGTPPTTVPATGTKVMTIDTSAGPIRASLDLSKVPCTAASYTHLGTKNFFNDSKCHRMTSAPGFQVLQCGDPTAKGPGWRKTDGTGGPPYRFAEENLPTSVPAYPEGAIAMANSGQPSSTGSQFFIIYGPTELAANYTLLGTITEGMNVVKDIGAAGDDGAFEPSPGGGHPKKDLVIKSITVG